MEIQPTIDTDTLFSGAKEPHSSPLTVRELSEFRKAPQPTTLADAVPTKSPEISEPKKQVSKTDAQFAAKSIIQGINYAMSIAVNFYAAHKKVDKIDPKLYLPDNSEKKILSDSLSELMVHRGWELSSEWSLAVIAVAVYGGAARSVNDEVKKQKRAKVNKSIKQKSKKSEFEKRGAVVDMTGKVDKKEDEKPKKEEFEFIAL